MRKVVGSSIGLPGIWVLAAVTVGGGLMGIGGMLLGVPVAATAYKLLGKDVDRRNAARTSAENRRRENRQKQEAQRENARTEQLRKENPPKESFEKESGRMENSKGGKGRRKGV